MRALARARRGRWARRGSGARAPPGARAAAEGPRRPAPASRLRASQTAGISRPSPKSTSVSPATTARWFSIQSTTSFVSRLGNAWTPASGRSPAVYGRASPFFSRNSHSEVGAPLPGLLRGDAVLLHQVLSRLGWRREDRHAERLDEALRVALVPRRGEHDRRLAQGCELLEFARERQWIKQEQPLAVVDRI